MDDDGSSNNNASTSFLPLIPNKLKNKNSTNINSNLFNFENDSTENVNNNSTEEKKEKNNKYKSLINEVKNYNNKNKKNILNKLNINISHISEKTLISNKALQNIKNILFDKKQKIRNKMPLFKKINTIYLPNNHNFYSSSKDKYKTFTPIYKFSNIEKSSQNSNYYNLNNQNNSNNSDINNILNNSSHKNFNNSMTNLKYNNNISTPININYKKSINNNIDIDFNRSDSFTKNSSYLFYCLLNDYSKSKSSEKKPKTVYKNTISKLSPFFRISKNEKVTARQIYRHYLKENAKDLISKEEKKKKKKISFKFNGTYDYSHVICPGLKNIYGDNKKFMNRMNEIKKNNIIALKKDFNIKDYQSTLIKLMKKNVSEKFLDNLKKKYMIFNEKNYGMMIPKGRYINLANKLKNHLSGDAFLTLQKMDKNYKIFFKDTKPNKKKKKNLSSLNF